jgi:hypothetical protein
MSKVKIQGNASGTGVLTVTAPNTSTDRTITLPDATGTLATTADTFNPDAAVTINESGADVDFRVESDTDTHALFLQGSDGSIGVGISTPVGDSAKTVHLADNVGIGFGNGANSRPAFQIRSSSGSKLGFICGDGSATEDIAMSTAGVLAVPNGIELGSGTDFTAANTLEDYEEGTWTPALSGVTGSFSTSGTQNYTKVGRIVTLNGYIYNCSSISNTSANWLFSGLPFAPIQDCQGAVSTYNVTLTSSNSYVTIRAAANNSSLALVESRAGTVGVLIPFSAVGTGHLDFTITYATNS